MGFPKYPPMGFRYVVPTREENDAWMKKHPRFSPAGYRLECESCGGRIWGSGLGIGAHRRACWKRLG